MRNELNRHSDSLDAALSKFSLLFYSLLIQMNKGSSVVPISNSVQTLEDRNLPSWSKSSHERLLQSRQKQTTHRLHNQRLSLYKIVGWLVIQKLVKYLVYGMFLIVKVYFLNYTPHSYVKCLNLF